MLRRILRTNRTQTLEETNQSYSQDESSSEHDSNMFIPECSNLLSGYVAKRHSHILTPLTKLTGNGKKSGSHIMEPHHQEDFEKMKVMIATKATLHYPHYNLPFEIYTNASDYQLRAVIMQNSKSIMYYSCKLNSAQKNYTTTGKRITLCCCNI
jgi:hypothetical protein